MSDLESLPQELKEEKTKGGVTYKPIRMLSELEKKYLNEFFTQNRKNHKKSYSLLYYFVYPILLGPSIYGIFSGEMGYSSFFVILFLCILGYYVTKKLDERARSLGLENPVVQMEGHFTYRSVSFSIIGSGLHIGGTSVGFPPGWGKAINFHQFTGHEVTAEVYVTGNQRLILAIEGETYSGEYKRFTLEDALESGTIDIEDARPS